MDLLDTSLERAGAIIDSTALRIPHPLDPQTASPTPTPRATQTPSTEPPPGTTAPRGEARRKHRTGSTGAPQAGS